MLVAKEFNQGMVLVFLVGRICTLDPKLFQHVCCREGFSQPRNDVIWDGCADGGSTSCLVFVVLPEF